MPSPLVLNFYEPDDSIKKTYSRNGMPAGVMRKAMDLFDQVDGKEIVDIQQSTVLMDSLAALLVELYSDQFTMDELYKHSYFEEWFPLVQQMFARAKGIQDKYSPTSLQLSRAQKKKKK